VTRSTSRRQGAVTGEAAAPLGTWLPWLLVLSAIWGSSFLFIKVGIGELHPLYVTLGRVSFGAVALALLLLVTRQRLPSDPQAWLCNLVPAVVGISVPFTLFGFAEQRIPSLLAGIWNSATPLFVLPMAVLVFRTERFDARRAAGLALGCVGALVILGAWRGNGGADLAGQLLCLGAVTCYGVNIPYTRRFVSPRPESVTVAASVQLLLATAVMAVAAPLVTRGVPDLPALSGEVVASIAALGALGTGIAFVLANRLIRVAGATNASFVTYLSPVFSTLLGVLVLAEELTWNQPVGALLVLAGVAVSQGVLPWPFRRPARGNAGAPDSVARS